MLMIKPNVVAGLAGVVATREGLCKQATEKTERARREAHAALERLANAAANEALEFALLERAKNRLEKYSKEGKIT